MEQKQTKMGYVAPSIEIIELENEGVIASSGNTIHGIGNGGNIGTPTNRSGRSGYNAAASSDLEDMINDILTVEN